MFFCYNQNNTGGSFTLEEKSGISHYVIIEAKNPSNADEKAQTVGIYFDGCDNGNDCSCCGDRWSRQWGKGTRSPSVYGKTVKANAKWPKKETGHSIKWIKGPEGYIHYADGKVKPFWT